MAVERTYFFGPFWSEQPARLWGDGVHDDTPGLQWYLDHEKQIPKGLYRSGTLLKCRSWPWSPENMGGAPTAVWSGFGGRAHQVHTRRRVRAELRAGG